MLWLAASNLHGLFTSIRREVDMWGTWKMKESRVRKCDDHHDTQTWNELTETCKSWQQSWKGLSLLIDTVQNEYKFVDASKKTLQRTCQSAEVFTPRGYDSIQRYVGCRFDCIDTSCQSPLQEVTARDTLGAWNESMFEARKFQVRLE